LFAEFDENLGRLAERDARRVAGEAKALLAAPSPIVTAFGVEADASRKLIDELAKGPDVFRTLLVFDPEFPDDESEEALEAFTAMSAQQRGRVVAMARETVTAAGDTLISVLSGPEGGWFVPGGRPREDAPQGPYANPGVLAKWIADRISPDREGILRAIAVRRTQLRLLRLNCLVLAYRWRHRRLPEKLADAVPADEERDPFSNSEFIYQTARQREFRIASRGFADSGEIELRYRRSISSEP
jgi:hypothetical protein